MTTNRAAWLKGGTAVCDAPPSKPSHSWRLVLLGAPGVGKGTQAELLHQQLDACHLSTGDVFRAAKSIPECDRSPAMSKALEYMQRGDLVPDAIVLDMVCERSRCLKCRGGFLLDGFPRTVAQAEALHHKLRELDVKLDAVLSYELPREEIVARIGGRRTCGACRAIYHVTALPPKRPGICDQCGGELVQRQDDRPESVRVRLAAYEKSTAPLIEFYRRLNLLKPISAADNPTRTFERTMAALQIHA